MVGRLRGVLVPLALTLVFLIVVAAPLWLVVVNSMKPLAEARHPTFALPETVRLVENYGIVLQEGEALRGFINSCLVTFPAIALLLFFGSMAAWVFARTTDRRVKALYYVAISGVILPAAVVTTVKVLQILGIQGTQLGLVLFYSGASMAIAIFIITGFVKNIPVELDDAARIDGASAFRTFLAVILPLLQPVLASTMIVLLLGLWNDFFWPFFLLRGPEQQTLPLGLFTFVSNNRYQLNWHLIFADVVVVSLPLLIFYIVLQRRIVAGLTGGALK